jgi:hypothetical protein
VSVERLHPADLERLAELIADRLAGRQLPAESSRLVDAATLADLLGVTRATIYERADDLGAIRLGDGPRARLRFDAEQARAALSKQPDSPPAPAPAPAPRRSSRARQSTAGHVLRARKAA